MGPDSGLTLDLSNALAQSLLRGAREARDAREMLHGYNDLLEAEAITQASLQTRRRVFGAAHPRTVQTEKNLDIIQSVIAKLNTSRGT